MFFGRHLRGVLPALPRKVDLQGEIDRRERSREPWPQEKRSWKGRRVFEIGEKVWCQDPKSKLWDVPAEVVEVRKLERSYVLINQRGGATFLRNRRFVKPRVVHDADGNILENDDTAVRGHMVGPDNTVRRSARIAAREESRAKQRVLKLKVSE